MGAKSSLHVVVLDECDAIMRKRGGGDTGDGPFRGAPPRGVPHPAAAAPNPPPRRGPPPDTPTRRITYLGFTSSAPQSEPEPITPVNSGV